MADYKKLYLKAFNANTYTILSLQKIQIELEEEYVKSCESENAPKILNLQDVVGEKKS